LRADRRVPWAANGIEELVDILQDTGAVSEEPVRTPAFGGATGSRHGPDVAAGVDGVAGRD
jgi:hypothetical protein